ncbi:MAG: alpha/beta hydrolase, partial [Pseudomonadota bacterium]|nr:alpha/beta hydrolase [Pseudomonadota bacterium]
MDVLYNKRVQGDAYAVIGSSSEIECDTPTLCSLINDGVVNYDSAFTPDALETIIVNSRHNSFKSPQAVDFIVEHLRN